MKESLKIVIKIVLLGAAIFLNYFMDFKPRPAFLHNLYSSSLGLITLILILNLTYTFVRLWYRRQFPDKDARQDNVLVGIRNIFLILSVLSVVVAVFGVFGVDPRTLFTTLSIVAAAIAIVTRDFIVDLLVGIFMSFSRDYEIGDYVKIGDVRGKIIEIGLLKLKIFNDDDDVVLFSNSKVYSTDLVNYTQRDIRLMSIDFEIDIMRISSIEQLEAELVASLQGFKEYIVEESYALKIVDVKKDCIDLKFQYRLKELDREMHKSIRRKTIRQVFSSITKRDHDGKHLELGSGGGGSM